MGETPRSLNLCATCPAARAAEWAGVGVQALVASYVERQGLRIAELQAQVDRSEMRRLEMHDEIRLLLRRNAELERHLAEQMLPDQIPGPDGED